jgi:isoleucyl-tRNA synthetase
MDRQGLRQDALAAVAAVHWTPTWGEERIRGMLANRPDWCVSRQRTWGVPITLFVHRDTQALHPRSVELIEAIAERIEQTGLDAWEALDPAELLGDAASEYRKVTDTLDVWFDSGCMPFAQWHYPFENKEKFLKEFSLVTRKMVEHAEGRILVCEPIFQKIKVRAEKSLVFKENGKTFRMYKI